MDAQPVARVFFTRRDFEAFRSPGGAETVEYRPSVDVLETATDLEVVVDLPGVAAESVTATFTGGALVVAGHKRAPLCAHREAAFHLAERTFGHFVCVVRCEEAPKVAEAAAKRVALEEEKRRRLASGELGMDIYKFRETLAGMGLKYI